MTDRETASYVGRPIARREDAALLRGAGRFVDDLHVDGVLHLRFVRSPYAHAAVREVRTAQAAALDGVVAVLRARDLDLPDLTPPLDTVGAVEIGRPILADRLLRFVGEPYATVIAVDPYVAEDGAELVELDATPLPAVVDPLDSATRPPALLHEPHPTNVLYENKFTAGPVDEAFADAAVVLRRRLRSPRQTAVPMEPRGILVEPHDGGLRVHASTQSPHMLHRALVEHLGIATDAVSVVCPDVGGGFGLKAHVYPEEIATAAVALRLGRPVKWIEDRADNLTAACHARDQHLDVRLAADSDGRLRALDVDVVCDVGAYGVFAHGHLLEAMGTPSMIPGPYRLDAYRFRSRAVATNKCPEGAYRGVGLPVATFVHERVMDLIAAATGVDRVEVRRRNLVAAVDMPHHSITGQRYDSGDYGAALDAALDAVDYPGFAARQQEALRDGRLLGLGIAAYVEYCAVGSAVFQRRGMRGLAGFDEAHVALDADGAATVWTTLPAAGQGLATTFAQLAADELGVPMERVTVAPVDTAVAGLHGNGTFASRSAVSGGGAIALTCQEIVRRLREDAADLMEIAVDDLEVVDGRVRVIGSPGNALEVGEVVARAPAGRYALSRRYDPPQAVYPYGVHACIVEVDPTTGRVRLDRYVVAEDCGRVINPLVADGQVRGAVAQGLAGALFESFVYDAEGQPQTASLMDYLVPTASEFVPIEIHHLAVAVPDSPTGTKGVGESGTLGPGAAVANAVADALGSECNTLPVGLEWARAAARERLGRGRVGSLAGVSGATT
ncbi:xanthine dehydrogenase family protein molybdopterin-binding subunit (plasmid) [Pseudonocardia bannensis]|uniref:Xanthine dehydrogenase family protein n=1 Tax=Pseudonocardia bannensis TaxID=630973 RepID=A0A848DLY4_9PSEU|nr:xanthine dehydrogenase family protein molybdopterin-binding subunit [Pseudonocardia bannensis]NMH93767.1 xanthine dehydrogenase family protein [Pseudonocardia bannensis]